MLSKRDNEILRSIYRYGYPTTSLLHKWHMSNIQAHGAREAIRRINKKTSFIEHKRLNRRTGEVKDDVLYLTKKGADYIKHAFGHGEYDLGYRRRTRKDKELNLLAIPHREKVIDTWHKLEHQNKPLGLVCEVVTEHHRRKDKNGRIRSYTTIETKSGEYDVTADLLFLIAKMNDTNRQQFFCVEVDMGTETIGGSKIFINPDTAKRNSLISKYRRYEKILEDGGWKENIPTTANSFKILTITTDQKRIHSIQRICSSWLQWQHIFLFATFDDVEEYGIFGDVWQSMTPNAPKQKMTETKR